MTHSNYEIYKATHEHTYDHNVLILNNGIQKRDLIQFNKIKGFRFLHNLHQKLKDLSFAFF